MTVELVLFLVLSGSPIEFTHRLAPDLQTCTELGERWVKNISADHEEAFPTYKCIQRSI